MECSERRADDSLLAFMIFVVTAQGYIMRGEAGGMMFWARRADLRQTSVAKRT